jgi:hypothetical protein
VGGSADQAALLRRILASELVRVEELIALLRGHVAHAANGAIDRLATIGRELLELLKELTGPLLLIGSKVLPGFHTIQHALLLRGGKAGKMLQALLQTCLLLRWKLAELGVALEGAALLGGRHIFIVAKPVSSMARLVLRRPGGVRAVGSVAARLLKRMPLSVRILRLSSLRLRMGMQLGRMSRRRWAPVLGEGGRQQQKGCQTARKYSPGRHLLVS